MMLNCIQTIFRSEKAEAYICLDEMNTGESTYTVIAIKDHEISKQLLIAGMNEDIKESEYLVDHFAAYGMDILVFPYAPKRPLLDFYFGGALTLEQAEDVCRNVVITAIQSRLPSPLLYLILNQNLLQMSKDRSIYISYEINLDEFDISKTESDCVVLCAKLLIKLLEGKTTQKAITYQLLKKRSRSQGYISFAQLYKDVIMSGAPRKKRGLMARLRSWFIKNKDKLFIVLMWVCLALAVIAIASLITQLIMGEVPWLRVFFNGFNVIGTEHLNATQ